MAKAKAAEQPFYSQKRFWHMALIPVSLVAGWVWLLHALDSGSLLDYFFVLLFVLTAGWALKVLLVKGYEGSRKDLHGRQTLLITILIVFNVRSLYEIVGSRDEMFFWPRAVSGGTEFPSIIVALLVIAAVNAVLITVLRRTNYALAKLSNRHK